MSWFGYTCSLATSWCVIVLSETLDGSDASEAEHKARVYFESCMDENDTIQDLGSGPMHQLMERVRLCLNGVISEVCYFCEE